MFGTRCSVTNEEVNIFSEPVRTRIIDQHSIECIIQIIQEYDDFSKCCAANLLRLLCSNAEIREQVGSMIAFLPILLTFIHTHLLNVTNH